MALFVAPLSLSHTNTQKPDTTHTILMAYHLDENKRGQTL